MSQIPDYFNELSIDDKILVFCELVEHKDNSEREEQGLEPMFVRKFVHVYKTEKWFLRPNQCWVGPRGKTIPEDYKEV